MRKSLACAELVRLLVVGGEVSLDTLLQTMRAEFDTCRSYRHPYYVTEECEHISRAAYME